MTTLELAETICYECVHVWDVFKDPNLLWIPFLVGIFGLAILLVVGLFRR